MRSCCNLFKKQHYATFITLLSVFLLYATPNSNDLIKQNLKGKIKSFTIPHYPHWNNVENIEIWDDKTEYDSLGNRTTEHIYRSAVKRFYFYNASNQLLYRDDYNVNGSRCFILRDTFLYNSKGQLYKKVQTIHPEFGEYIYKYDGGDNKTEIARIIQTKNGRDTVTLECYEYDNKNRLVLDYSGMESRFGAIENHSYLYNAEGLLKQKKTFHPDGCTLLSKEVHKKYDRYNNLKALKIYNNKNELINKISHQYQYDKQGNWIVDKIIKNGLDSVLNRQIEYWK